MGGDQCGKAVGFTGTRHGMTPEQADAVRGLLKTLAPSEVHHGDCIGADTNFHNAVVQVLELRCKIHVHPPDNDALLARNVVGNIRTHDPKPYLKRNHDIVDAADVLIACPDSPEEKWRSGTWSTVRYARKCGKPIHLVLPDGSVVSEEE